ncbi:sulfite exporter TauE/SafE family protein [Spirochaeta cellobiosiphila]|uniref:sulfite exporter TauE/SafE family protein n=1 Tax=Spirochaeta cellobiosiphila TaxID=504483 RepID=UPI000401692E|nr:sulfite exporter TauE/SafE family protein [Spirochaeta cellobiosiphila]
MLFVMVLITSTISGIAGMGGGVLLLSVMLGFYPLNTLIPLHGTIQLFSNISRVSIHFKEIKWKYYSLYTAGAILGALLGFLFKPNLPENFLKIFIALFIIFITWKPKGKPSNAFFFPVGMGSTWLSLIIGSSGPILAPLFSDRGFTNRQILGTKAACQMMTHLFKVILYIYWGFALSQFWMELLISLPLVFIGNWIGGQLVRFLSPQVFNKVFKIGITLLCVKTLIQYILPLTR